jgi:hypothetical protein
MPKAVGRKYLGDEGALNFEEDETGLSKIGAKLNLVTKLQARFRGWKTRRVGRAEMERQRRYQAERSRQIRRRFRVAVARVMLLIMARDKDAGVDWRDSKATQEKKRKRAKKKQERKMQRKVKDVAPLPPWFAGVGYMMCILWILLCGFYTIALAVYFGPSTSTSWLLGCAGASGFEAIVQDPIKILIVVVLAEHAELFIDLYYEVADYNPFG